MANKNLKTVNIVTDEENPLPLELIAEQIERIGKAMDQIKKSRVTRRVIILLISNYANMSQAQVIKVLDAMEALPSYYLKSK